MAFVGTRHFDAVAWVKRRCFILNEKMSAEELAKEGQNLSDFHYNFNYCAMGNRKVREST